MRAMVPGHPHRQFYKIIEWDQGNLCGIWIRNDVVNVHFDNKPGVDTWSAGRSFTCTKRQYKKIVRDGVPTRAAIETISRKYGKPIKWHCFPLYGVMAFRDWEDKK